MIRLQGKLGEEEEEPEEGSYAAMMRLGPEYAGVFDGEASCTAMLMYYVHSFWFVITDTVVAIHVAYFLFSALGNVITPFMQAFHLMDLVYKSETLKNVLRAVTFNGSQLCMTGFLCLIIIYYYSIIGFLVLRNNYFLPDDFPDVRPCDKLADCFMVTIREGLINGGGMADYLPPRSIDDKFNFAMRWWFDLSFFVVIIIILLNVIFGIIIDTFAAMREMTESKMDDMKNTCFICSVDRYTFDRQGTPFEIHIKAEHNMWLYLYYLVYLKTKDETEYTGLESYIAGLLEEEDVSFYPMHKAMCLAADDEEEDPFQVGVNEKFDKMSQEVAFLKKSVLDLKSEGANMQSMTLDGNKNFETMLNNMAETQARILQELQTANNIT